LQLRENPQPATRQAISGWPEEIYTLQPLSFNSKTASFQSLGEAHGILPNPRKEEKTVRIAQSAIPTFRVLIVDRDSMGSDLLANALARDSNCEAAAIQSTQLIPALSSSQIDLVVIGADLNSKSSSGFDLAHRVCCAYPHIGIVILLNQTTPESVIDAFRSGARGVFSRQQPMSEFLDCVAHVRRGSIWAGRSETDSLLGAFKNIPSPSLVTAPDSPTLTARELQVVQCAAKGKTNRAIASELGLSEHTVKNYLFRAFDKLGVSSRVELLFYLTLRGHTFTATKPEVVSPDISIGA
jgi:two-component system nitrate/nitrite response regulator NarL